MGGISALSFLTGKWPWGRAGPIQCAKDPIRIYLPGEPNYSKDKPLDASGSEEVLEVEKAEDEEEEAESEEDKGGEDEEVES